MFDILYYFIKSFQYTPTSIFIRFLYGTIICIWVFPHIIIAKRRNKKKFKKKS